MVFRSSARVWAELHERAFRRLGGSPRVVVLDKIASRDAGDRGASEADVELPRSHQVTCFAVDVEGCGVELNQPDLDDLFDGAVVT